MKVNIVLVEAVSVVVLAVESVIEVTVVSEEIMILVRELKGTVVVVEVLKLYVLYSFLI